MTFGQIQPAYEPRAWQTTKWSFFALLVIIVAAICGQLLVGITGDNQYASRSPESCSMRNAVWPIYWELSRIYWQQFGCLGLQSKIPAPSPHPQECLTLLVLLPPCPTHSEGSPPLPPLPHPPPFPCASPTPQPTAAQLAQGCHPKLLSCPVRYHVPGCFPALFCALLVIGWRGLGVNDKTLFLGFWNSNYFFIICLKEMKIKHFSDMFCVGSIAYESKVKDKSQLLMFSCHN